MSKQNQKKQDGAKLFKQAINEALTRKFDKEIAASPEPVEFSNNHKRWTNDFFRNTVGSSYVPYPEIENGADHD